MITANMNVAISQHAVERARQRVAGMGELPRPAIRRLLAEMFRASVLLCGYGANSSVLTSYRGRQYVFHTRRIRRNGEMVSTVEAYEQWQRGPAEASP